MAKLYEYYNTGDDDLSAVYSTTWKAQTFTPQVSHLITSVRLKLCRVGSPGTITVSIRATDANGHPTGSDLCYGIYNGNNITTDTAGAWYEITFTNGAVLTANTKYAIVVRVAGLDTSNCIKWRIKSTNPAYSGGNFETSSDGGNTWSAVAADAMFEERGGINPSNPPTNITVYPIPGTGVEVRATFTATNGLPATYARFQVASDSNFNTVVYDSGQISINPVSDNSSTTLIFPWVPSTSGTYYYRLCFWDNLNYTYTNWLVWNGTTVGESSEIAVNLLPNGDTGTLQLSIYPTSPTTHYDKVAKTTANDASYVYGDQYKQDNYTVQGFSEPANYKRITKVRVNVRAKVVGNELYPLIVYFYKQNISDGVWFSSFTPTSSFANYTNDWVTTRTGGEWSPVELASLKTQLYISTSDPSSTVYVSGLYFTVYYTTYTFTFTPPGNNVLNIGFPSIGSESISNDKEVYTFTVSVNDTYTKPPLVSLTINGVSYLMDLVSKSGSGPYVYTYTKKVVLEQGDYEYYYVVGNVWTTLVDNTRYLHADYTLSNDPSIEIFSGDSKINAWDIVLTDMILPDLPTIEFTTDKELTGDIEVRFKRKTLSIYRMRIQRVSKTPEGYKVYAIEKAKNELNEVASLSAQVMRSDTIIKSILPNYTISGSLNEVVYLQDFQDVSKSDIVRRLLVLNNSIGYIRNKRLFVYSLDQTNAALSISKTDPGVNYDIDYDSIINRVKEYYVKKAYPVPNNAMTNYDASNWSGTVSNALQTDNGLLPPSGSRYMLKGNETISRSINFQWSEFDRFNMNWCPVSATTLEIRLETDASNYRKYTRTFSGGKGSGFVLFGKSQNDEVYKEITFTSKYIHKLSVSVSQPCSVKFVLYYSGNVVADTGYMTVSNSQTVYFQNNQCDKIRVYFTKLYPVGTSYGVRCTNLEIEEYAQTYVTTGVEERANWYNRYTGKARGIPRVAPLRFAGSIVLGPAPTLGPFERFAFPTNTCYIRHIDGRTGIETDFYGSATISVENGNFVAYFDMQLSGVPDDSSGATIFYDIEVVRLVTITTGQYVWGYATYKWQESYNLFDSLSIPFSQFSTVGSPTDQINTIRLIASGDNYYDSIYVSKDNPTAQYVIAENSESIKRGVYFQERKLDGWSSKESALAFAQALVSMFGDPAKTYSKQVSLESDIKIGDMVNCDGTILPVYKIVYNLGGGNMTIFVGRSVTDTLEWLKETARKIDSLQKAIF